MRLINLVAGLVVASTLALSTMAYADNAATNSPVAGSPAAKPIPYPLKTCPVSDEKLGGDMGAPCVFVYKGQEIKFCCKDCQKDFLKDPDKYLKKIKDLAAKEKNSAK